MNDQSQLWFRQALLGQLVSQSPSKLGRTALMKLAYLLQTIKEVPLGYDFRMYTYGPFDSDVLNDLSMAESLGAVSAQMVHFPSGSGYGYEFAPGPQSGVLKQRVGNVLADYQQEIDWALQEFGRHSAADLELITTIIYADRDASRQRKALTFQDLGRQVKGIKPHFSNEYIAGKIEELAGKGLLAVRAENCGAL
ncbi:MAG: hypothetical protein K2R98_09070 [Gemmataceae bacterium]|nr:hypothetical protein [Gemmataceae bacterium]